MRAPFRMLFSQPLTNNMEIRLLTIHNSIQAGKFDADTLDALDHQPDLRRVAAGA